MTAITRSRSSPPSATQKTPFRATETSKGETSVFSPSSTVEEAKSRFAMAVSSGVEAVMRFGHGIDRASVEILNEIADGCPPDDEEVRPNSYGVHVAVDLL
ncbi:hypothetical protein HJC23_000528 [Cyclotella cryptica]|uniref:Non-haem dioxygenase N-terminal domain-containing protein n=1 Tax=Cyclotella cryptica TaxID=29204 RepID=A0ABD3NVI7_9STRA